MRKSIAALTCALVPLAFSGVRAEALPGFCQGILRPGPYQVSCPFTQQSPGILVFAAGTTTSTQAVSINIEVVLASDQSIVIAECSFTGAFDGPIVRHLPPLVAGPCFSGTLSDLEVGTELRCRARGRTYVVFGCMSPVYFDSI